MPGSRLLNWFMRYDPFVSLLDELDAGWVLDVGSGWYGLSWYWPRRVVQTDVAFSSVNPAPFGRAGEVSFVCSSAERLPFADDAFDYALSSDLMEHLPADIRAASVREMIRVARRGILIGFPTGPAAWNDRVLAKVLQLRGSALPSWLDEHLQQARYPDRRTVEEALPDGWRITLERANSNAVLSLVVAMAEMSRAAGAARAAERFVRRRGIPKWWNRGAVVRTVYLVEPEA